MRKVYRYVLNNRTTTIKVPYGSNILKVVLRRGEEISVYMEVDTYEENTEEIVFHQVRTDEFIPAETVYIDTVEIEETDFIYHIYAEYLG